MSEDHQLLKRYATGEPGAEEAFAELVRRHINLVYAAAVRMLGCDTHRAEDVVQLVFTNLARRAREIPATTILAGWLHRDATFKALEARRAERRLRNREELAMKEADPASPEVDWQALRPVLDQSLNELSEPDRSALLLRFFENRNLGEVGKRLGVGESGASRRVAAALDKLRSVLARRGVRTTAGALALVLTTHTVQAAPAGLASTVITTSLGSLGVAGTGSASAATAAISPLSNSPLPTLVLAMKAKSIAVLALALVLVGSVGFVVIHHDTLHALAFSALRKHGLVDNPRDAALAEQRQRLQPVMPLLVQLISYAADHGGELPGSLATVGIADTRFELIGKGPIPNGPELAPIAILREKQTWIAANGRTARVYGYSDGHAVVLTEGDPGFEP